jgi:predicted DNA-binding transcriptional regulator AlpA
MKTPKTPTEKSKTKTEAPAVSKTKPKTSASPKKPAEAKAVTPKSAPKAKKEPTVAAAVADESAKKSSPAPKSPKKPQSVASKPVVTSANISPSERVGLTAGSIWHYLSENGVTSVAKLIRELPEEEKIIQRSIGWLAQESKIILDIVDRAEVVSLR